MRNLDVVILGENFQTWPGFVTAGAGGLVFTSLAKSYKMDRLYIIYIIPNFLVGRKGILFTTKQLPWVDRFIDLRIGLEGLGRF